MDMKEVGKKLGIMALALVLFAGISFAAVQLYAAVFPSASATVNAAATAAWVGTTIGTLDPVTGVISGTAVAGDTFRMSGTITNNANMAHTYGSVFTFSSANMPLVGGEITNVLYSIDNWESSGVATCVMNGANYECTVPGQSIASLGTATVAIQAELSTLITPGTILDISAPVA